MQGDALSALRLGHQPLVDRARSVIGTRLSVRAADGGPAGSAAIVGALGALPGGDRLPTVIDAGGDDPPDLASLRTLLASWPQAAPPSAPWPELPIATVPALAALRAGGGLPDGFRCVLRGLPAAPLPASLLPSVAAVVVDGADFVRDGLLRAMSRLSVLGTIPVVHAGARSLDDLRTAFALGASACAGWPLGDLPGRPGARQTPPDFVAVTQLMRMIDRDEDIGRMESLVRRHPELAGRLLRYANSAGFGVRGPVRSFRHAVMLIGYGQLRRWLALLLATASDDPDQRPLASAAFRRGVFLEQLLPARSAQSGPLRDEAFMLGALSLLDRQFRVPFGRLFGMIEVPGRLRDALVARSGPLGARLSLAEGLENGPCDDLDERLAGAGVTLAACNDALLAMLSLPDLTEPDDPAGRSRASALAR